MITDVIQFLEGLHRWALPATALALLLLIAWLVNLIARGIFIRVAHRLADRSRTTLDDRLIERGVIHRLTQLLPGLVIYQGVRLLPGLADSLVAVLANAAAGYMVLVTLLAVSAGLTVVNDVYETRPDAHKKPIKGYIQVTKIVLFCLGAILVIAALLDKSPLILLSGFGALTAVLLLVFKDTILSLVASIQLSSLDMVRVGDWIEMPEFNADGDVVDVALHTIRVQNWDKTITTIPTHRLISDSFRNWRGMTESGGRRIKRALLLDMTSVRFLTDEESGRFRRFALLTDYIDAKRTELAEYNDHLARAVEDDVNFRRLTNLGTFRAYVFNYLKHHPRIRQDMTLLVRQLAPQPEGLPIEIYCFTNTTEWNAYEAVAADIFDHLLAILGEFDLTAYQQPGGRDVRAALTALGPASRTDS